MMRLFGLNGAGRMGRAAAVCLTWVMLCLSGCSAALPFASENTPYDEGITLLENREYNEALLRFETAREQGEDRAEFYRVLGITYFHLGSFAAAEEAFTTALQKSGGIPGDIAFDLSYYLAETLIAEDKDEAAIEVYDAILALRPGEEDARYLRGLCYLRIGDHDSASEDFKNVFAAKPKPYDRILSIYEALSEAGYMSEGRAILMDILSENGDSMTNFERGRFHYYLGNPDEARTWLEEAYIETSSGKAADRIPVIILLGEVAQEQGDDTYAISVYRRFLQDDQSQASVYNALGVCELRMGNYSDALSDFQIGLSLNDSEQNPALLRNTVAAYEYMGNFETAAERMSEYLALVPTDEEAQRENIFLTSRLMESVKEEEQ